MHGLGPQPQVIGQKNIVAYVNSSNTHRGHNHSPTQPTGTQSQATHILKRMYTYSQPLDTPKMHCQNQLTPTIECLSSRRIPVEEVLSTVCIQQKCYSYDTWTVIVTASSNSGDVVLPAPLRPTCIHWEYYQAVYICFLSLLISHRCLRDLEPIEGCVETALTT